MVTIIRPKLPTFLANFIKVVEIFPLSIEYHFWATFIDIWQLLTGHTECHKTLFRSTPLDGVMRQVAVAGGQIVISIEQNPSFHSF